MFCLFGVEQEPEQDDVKKTERKNSNERKKNIIQEDDKKKILFQRLKFVLKQKSTEIES